MSRYVSVHPFVGWSDHDQMSVPQWGECTGVFCLPDGMRTADRQLSECQLRTITLERYEELIADGIPELKVTLVQTGV